jgi:SAM-dependent MidA family methyltransferase
MADALRAAGRVPGFGQAARIALVEASPALRAVQAKTLSHVDPVWVDTVEAVPDGPIFAIANEFFDALPIRQFLRDGTGWRERRVAILEDRLAYGLGQRLPQPALSHRLDDTEDGDMVELCAAGQHVARVLGERVAAQGGAALIVDYGDWRSLGDTFQAVRAHRKADPLDAPGLADLTAHVDFEALADAAPCAHTRLTPQGVFLERLGITHRAQALAERAGEDTRSELIAGHRRLTHPDEMGNLFKVMGLYPDGAPPPPGLDT